MDDQVEAKGVKTPFSAYDVFGYFIPGLALIALAYVYESRCLLGATPQVHAPVCHFLDRMRCCLPSDANWAVSALFMIAAMCMSYVCGHVVASVSALFIDRMLLYKGYGYPYEHILDIKDDQRDPVSAAFYRGFFCWSNVLLLAVYYYAMALPRPHWYLRAVCVLAGIVVAVSLGKIAYSAAVNNKEKTRKHFRTTLPILRPPFRLVRWFIHRVFPLPYNAASAFLGNYIRTKRGFHADYVNDYKIAYRRVFGHDANTSHTNNYWYAYCHLAKKSPGLYRIAMNWFYLFSFSRNLAAAFFLAFLYSAGWLLYQGHSVPHTGKVFAQVVPGLFYVGSMFLLVRYYYLYASYYTKFIFRAFTYIEATRANQPSHPTRRKRHGKKGGRSI